MEGLRLQDTIIFLVAAGLIIPLFKRVNISPVLGFIVVGLAVGPHGLAQFTDTLSLLTYTTMSDPAGIGALAELGVIFLLFMIGLDLSMQRLWAMRRLVFGMGNAQIGATGIIVGVTAWTFGNSIEASIILGACLALSSTAIVLQLLIEQNRFGSPAGHGSFAILLAQDIAVVPILFLVGTLAASAGESLTLGLFTALGTAVFTLCIIYVVGRVLLRPLLHFVASLRMPELFMATTLLIVIVTAAITHAAGLSAALGAFLAGLLLAESEYRHEIEMNIDPFKGLFMGLFFMSMAMNIDLGEAASNPLLIPLSVVGLFLIKSVVTTLVARSFGFSWRHAGETGVLLAQGGEFAFVVVALALSGGLLPQSTAQFMLIVVSATMFLTPVTAWLSAPMGDLLARAFGKSRTDDDHPVDELYLLENGISDHVVIVGFGRTGALLADLLNHQMVPFVALELDQQTTANAKAKGHTVHLGNASREITLRKAHIESSRALVICINDADAVLPVISAARRISDIPIIARARDEEHGAELAKAGATLVVPEVLESGLQLGRAMLSQIGVPDHTAAEIVADRRSTGLLRS